MRRCAVLLVALATVACAGPVTSPGVVDVAYGPEIINYSAARGGMPVVIVGNPFAEPQAEVDRIITTTMEGAHFGQRIPFFSGRPPDFPSPYRIVFVFNPTLGTNSQSLCVEPRQPTLVEPGRLRIMAALCSSERRLTSTTGSLPMVDSAAAPAFRQLVAQATYELLPPFNENRRDRGRGHFWGRF